MNTPHLISSHDALDQYLDSLLCEDSINTSGASSNHDLAVSRAKGDHMPDRAEPAFECLLFTVAGARLAIPFDKTRGVLEWGKELESCSSPSPWIMGSIRYLGHEVKVINTSPLVAGNNQRRRVGHEAYPQHLILIDDARYALAVDTVGEISSFEAGKVRWRQGHSERPWYCGVAVEQQCALLDIGVLIKIIKTSDT